MSRDYRDRLLDAAIEKLRAKKNTRPLGDALAAERTRLQNVERAGGLWSSMDRDEILSDFADEAEARLRARGRGAKPPSHLVSLRAEWVQVTRGIDSVFKTAPAVPAACPAYVRSCLEEIWRFILALPSPRLPL
jgi:hypothetical protein